VRLTYVQMPGLYEKENSDGYRHSNDCCRGSNACHGRVNAPSHG
jgi:hypothetical protein